jgi:CO/xanthine dehydrogenase Mo-binding subunit
MSTTSEYKVIGTRPIRHDGVDKVTGRAVYGADVQMAGLLHGRVLRSAIAHGRIRKIDASKALALPGVEAVVTAEDFPETGNKIAELGEGAIIVRHLSSNCMARGKVLYKGQPVAAIAATSPQIAEEALKLIAVDIEPLPAVVDVCEAMKDRAPLLHDDLTTESLGKSTNKHSNVAKHFRFSISGSSWAMPTRRSKTLPSSSSASFTRRRCIRVISSRTMRLQCGTRTAT